MVTVQILSVVLQQYFEAFRVMELKVAGWRWWTSQQVWPSRQYWTFKMGSPQYFLRLSLSFKFFFFFSNIDWCVEIKPGLLQLYFTLLYDWSRKLATNHTQTKINPEHFHFPVLQAVNLFILSSHWLSVIFFCNGIGYCNFLSFGLMMLGGRCSGVLVSGLRGLGPILGIVLCCSSLCLSPSKSIIGYCWMVRQAWLNAGGGGPWGGQASYPGGSSNTTDHFMLWKLR